MSFISIILILTLSLSEYDLFIGISDLTKHLHSLCLNFTPGGLHSEIYAGLVCGKSLSSTELSHNLKNLGVYHALVVSGSHLIFLSLLIEKTFYLDSLRKLRYAAFPILFIYSLATGAQPPVIRALASIAVQRFQAKYKLFWNPNEVIFISLLICFCLSERWQSSYSLLLSYIASVSLSLSQNKNFLLKNLFIYLLIFPFLMPLSAPSPLSFLSNIILSPIIGFILFPLSFMSFIIPYFSVLVDPLWGIFLKICNTIGPEMKSSDPIFIPQFYLWMGAVFLNFYGIYKDKKGIKNDFN